jgi:hypothetical protein
VTGPRDFNGISDATVELDDQQLGPRPSVGSALAARCENLRSAFGAYSACVDELFECIDDPDALKRADTLRHDRAKAALFLALENTLDCPVRTFADLSLKQAAIEPRMEFCGEHPWLMQRIAASLLRDIAQLAGKQAPCPPAWKFPTIPRPGSWSRRAKPRQPTNGASS